VKNGSVLAMSTRNTYSGMQLLVVKYISTNVQNRVKTQFALQYAMKAGRRGLEV
jgi:microcompartment protein CcmK/EutM